MKNKPLFAYFVILFLSCAGFVIGARMMGQQGMYLASGHHSRFPVFQQGTEHTDGWHCPVRE
jgi:hypothetical protein